MVRSWIRLGVFFCWLVATPGAQEKAELSDPCKSPLIMKAQREGLRSLSLKEIWPYYRDLRRCREAGEEQVGSRIAKQQLIQDYQTSHRLRGFTSACAYSVLAAWVYFLLQ